MFELTGTLKLKRDEQKVSETFKKREFVLTDNSGNYPQHIQFQLKNDRCSRLDEFNPGDQIKVSFFISGREWTSKEGAVKYFTSLDAMKLERVGDKAPAPAQANQPQPEAQPAASDLPEQQDDLPF